MSKTIYLDGQTLDALERNGIHVDRATGKISGSDAQQEAILNGFAQGKLPKQVAEETGARLRTVNSVFGIAEDLGNGRWRLESKTLTARELEDEMQKRDDAEREATRIGRAVRSTEGGEIHKAASELLKSRGVHSPTYDEYASALVEVTP